MSTSTPTSPRQLSCPACEGSGFLLDEATGVARPCECRPRRIALARTRSLSHHIPRRFVDVGFDRNPVREMDPTVVREVKRFCRSIDERLDRGEGLWFQGPRGTGKTTLAMLVSLHALRAQRAVAIYTVPQLLAEIRKTYDDDSRHDYLDLTSRLASVDLLHLEDMAVARTNDWVLEQLYTIINDRYQDERSVIFTADVEQPPDLAQHVGERTYSRLIEMCGDPKQLSGEDRRIKVTGR
ncbi:MAG: ATP-binding protein [Thermoleophilaceae bacterium]|nr:ATP-binding protein [Thermoleophilaceae bacterium]